MPRHRWRRAAAQAAQSHAHADVVRHLQNALEALNLLERPSVRLRISIWYLIGLHSLGGPNGARALAEVVRLAAASRNASMLAHAASLLNAYPGLPPLPQAGAALARALKMLGPEHSDLRAIVLAVLAYSAPHCFHKEQSDLLLGEADALAGRSRSRAVQYALLVAKLHMRGGPSNQNQAERYADKLTTLRGRAPSYRVAVAPQYVDLYRCLMLLGRGDIAKLRSTLEHALGHARSIQHFLAWNFRRFQALLSINTGELGLGSSTLETLHHHAEQRQLPFTEPFIAFDRVVILRELSAELSGLDDRTRRALAYDATDPPAVWAEVARARDRRPARRGARLTPVCCCFEAA